jgi:hypothetical protein
MEYDLIEELVPRQEYRAYTLPSLLRVVRDGGGVAVLYIDGERFPYHTVDGFHTDVNRREIPHVTLSIAAEKVEIVNSLVALEEKNDE